MENTYEQEINLKDLLFYILHKWRLVLFIALAFSIVLGGYKMIKGIHEQNHEAYVLEIKENYDRDIKEYTLKKQGYERSINNLTANIEFEENYQQHSVLQKIDPYNKWVATADIFVKTDTQGNAATLILVDPTDSIIKAYESAVSKGNDVFKLSKKKGIELNYLKELISVGADYNSNMLTISTTGEDKEGAQELLDTILNSLQDMYPEIQDNLGQFNIVIMNGNLSKVADSELAENQKDRINNLTNMQKSLEDTQQKLEDLKEPQKPDNLSISGVFKAGVKFGVLGGILGVFVTGFFYCMVFVLSNKVYSSDELKSRYGLKLLGVFTRERKKKALSVVDNWLDRLEGKEYMKEDMVYERIIANITNYTEKSQAILLTGTVEKEDLTQLEMKFKDQLPKLNFEVAMDMNKHAHTLSMISKSDGVILVEKNGVSKYNNIQNELETIDSLNKKVIGCIVI